MRARQAAPHVVLSIALIAQAAVLLNQSRRLWFYKDDFAFMLGRSLSQDPLRKLMVPHNEHWTFFPVLAFRIMWPIFGFRHYLPYAVLPMLLHLATAVFLVVLVRTAGAGRWVSVLTGVTFAFLAGGAGAENPLWAFQIGFIGSCLGGVVAMVCLDREDAQPLSRRWGGRWFWGAQIFLVVSLMCSGIGVPMVFMAVVWALVRVARRDGLGRGLLSAVRVGVVPGAVFITWFLIWGHLGIQRQVSSSGGTLATIVPAALRGLKNVWASATTVPWAGFVVLAILVLGVAAAWRRQRLFAVGAAGLVALLFYFLLMAYGLSGTGRSQLSHGRYVYVGLVFCTPALACLFDVIAERLGQLRWAAVVGWAAVGAVVVGLGSTETADVAADRRAADPNLRQNLIAAHHIVSSGAQVLNQTIDPYSDSDSGLTVERMTIGHGWTELPAGRPSAQDLVNLRGQLQVGFQRTPMPVRAAPHVQWLHLPGHKGPVTVADRCDTRTVDHRVLRVRLGRAGGQISLDLSGLSPAALVRTWVEADGLYSMQRIWPTDGVDGRYYLASSIPHATLFVRLPPAKVTVCAVSGTGSQQTQSAS